MSWTNQHQGYLARTRWGVYRHKLGCNCRQCHGITRRGEQREVWNVLLEDKHRCIEAHRSNDGKLPNIGSQQSGLQLHPEGPATLHSHTQSGLQRGTSGDATPWVDVILRVVPDPLDERVEVVKLLLRVHNEEKRVNLELLGSDKQASFLGKRNPDTQAAHESKRARKERHNLQAVQRRPCRAAAALASAAILSLAPAPWPQRKSKLATEVSEPLNARVASGVCQSTNPIDGIVAAQPPKPNDLGVSLSVEAKVSAVVSLRNTADAPLRQGDPSFQAGTAAKDGNSKRRSSPKRLVKLKLTVDEATGCVRCVIRCRKRRRKPEAEAKLKADVKVEVKPEVAAGPYGEPHVEDVDVSNAAESLPAAPLDRTSSQCPERISSLHLPPVRLQRSLSHNLVPKSPTAGLQNVRKSPAAPAKVDVPEPDPLIMLASEVKAKLGVADARHCTLKILLKSGVLAGHSVEVKNKAGDLLLTGMLTDCGGVACDCRGCNGAIVSASAFEAHSGNSARRPAEYIHLTATGTSLKDFVHAVCSDEVDIHGDICPLCGDGGDLMCCDACPKVYHLECVGLTQLPQDDWLCPECKANGTNPCSDDEHARVLKPSLKRKGMRHSLKRPCDPPLDVWDAYDASEAEFKPPAPRFKLGKAESLPVQRKRKELSNSTPERMRSSPVGKSTVKTSPLKKFARAHMLAPKPNRVHRMPPCRARGTGIPKGGSSRNRLLFTNREGALKDGQTVAYIAHGDIKLEGVVRITDDLATSGICCNCCGDVISCSAFESHAGYSSRRQPYENTCVADGRTLKAVAEDLVVVPLPESPDSRDTDNAQHHSTDLNDVAEGCADVLNDLDTIAGGCVLCNGVDFQRDGFGPRTIIICDQCEREFHIGCLKSCGRADLTAIPEGDWFCSPECKKIQDVLSSHVTAGIMPLAGGDHSWQLLKGRDGTHQTTWSLKAVHELLQESFDPIIDMSSGVDLMPLMVYCKEHRDWDYTGCYTMLLRHEGKAVAAAVMRVFGPHLSELPLIATKLSARRQGHCRVLLRVFEDMLVAAGVQCLCLPAAHETVGTWMHGFGFQPMPEEQLHFARSQLRILIFPGTQVLCKSLVRSNAAGQSALQLSRDWAASESTATGQRGMYDAGPLVLKSPKAGPMVTKSPKAGPQASMDTTDRSQDSDGVDKHHDVVQDSPQTPSASHDEKSIHDFIDSEDLDEPMIFVSKRQKVVLQSDDEDSSAGSSVEEELQPKRGRFGRGGKAANRGAGGGRGRKLVRLRQANV